MTYGRMVSRNSGCVGGDGRVCVCVEVIERWVIVRSLFVLWCDAENIRDIWMVD